MCVCVCLFVHSFVFHDKTCQVLLLTKPVLFPHSILRQSVASINDRWPFGVVDWLPGSACMHAGFPVPMWPAGPLSHRFTHDSIMSLDISLSRVSRCLPNSSSGQCRSRMKVCKASSFQKRSSDVPDPLLSMVG